MAKKEKPRIQVLLSMSEENVKGHATRQWMVRNKKSFMLAVVACFIVFIVGAYLIEGNAGLIVAVAPAAILFVVWLKKTDTAGKKLWKEIKDKEQPVDLTK